MEVNTSDPEPPAEHRSPRIDAPSRRWQTVGWLVVVALAIVTIMQASPAQAQTAPPTKTPPAPAWTYGGFADIGYLLAPNDPFNDAFRSRGTTWHVNDLHLNMTGIFAKRPVSTTSRLGGEVTLHTGKDDEIFGFSATAPNMDGSDVLRHLGPTNVSYLADIGKGLTIQAGIFSSLIGYDSLYARDNLNYTRPWGADFTPYLMLGANASYPITDRITATGFIVNGYWHLAHANSVPSAGGQVAIAVSPRVTVKQTVMAGPHQDDTSVGQWRFIADSIVERRTDRFVIAFNGHFATEQIVDSGTRAWWVSAQLPMQWHVAGPWRISLRPEVARDTSGRWTLAEQTVTALTATLEHRSTFKSLGSSLRLEYRVDRSTGRQGGFFTDREGELTPTQHLVIGGVVLRFDGSR